MQRDRGDMLNNLAGIGNVLLFIVILLVMVSFLLLRKYDAVIAIALAGIYSELWNYRISTRK